MLEQAATYVKWADFHLLFTAHLIAAFACPVIDCDEVFNYWEPLHNLVHGYGLQTWEYSGRYALRSYLYLLLHAPVVAAVAATSVAASMPLAKELQFFVLRAMIAAASAACEAHWLNAVRRRLGEKVRRWTLFFLVLTPGTFIASAAFIPSSFAMCCVALVQSYQLRGEGSAAIFAGAAAGVVGWPFCIVAIAPAGVDLLLKFGFRRCTLWGLLALAATTLPTILADTYFYVHPAIDRGGWPAVFSTWNVLLYNMMPRGTGSALYGVEEWHFYLRNLALNFNIALPCALAAPLMASLLAICNRIYSHSAKRVGSSEGVADAKRLLRTSNLCAETLLWMSPFHLWLLFFSLVPHKEERFMFVVYPQLCLSAAVTLTIVETGLFNEATSPPAHESRGRSMSKGSNTVSAASLALHNGDVFPFGSVIIRCQSRRGRSSKGPSALVRSARFAVLAAAVVSMFFSVSRSAALVGHYGAPFKAYRFLGRRIQERLDARDRELGAQPVSSAGAFRVCVGKEWYRFPSHFFLPTGATLAFLESGFRGQLPQLFDSMNRTRGDPPNFNDENNEQRDRYVEARTCDFVVDLGIEVDSMYSQVDGKGSGRYDPWHPGGGTCEASWDLIYSAPFLDAASTPFLARILLLPPNKYFPARYLPYEVFERRA